MSHGTVPSKCICLALSRRGAVRIRAGALVCRVVATEEELQAIAASRKLMVWPLDQTSTRPACTKHASYNGHACVHANMRAPGIGRQSEQMGAPQEEAKALRKQGSEESALARYVPTHKRKRLRQRDNRRIRHTHTHTSTQAPRVLVTPYATAKELPNRRVSEYALAKQQKNGNPRT